MNEPQQFAYTGGPRIGDRLQKMLRQGQAVVRPERERWKQNRRAYEGEESPKGALSVEAARLSTTARNENTKVNRLRQFVDGRVTAYTGTRPPFEAKPAGSDQDQIDGARQATKFISAMWGPDQWDVQRKARRLASWGEIDGIGVWQAIFDSRAGSTATVAIGADGQPIIDRQQYEALVAQDPNGQALWTEKQIPLGDIVIRNVKPGALAVDPMAVDDFEDAQWVIESAVRDRSALEAEIGKKIDDIVKGSAQSMGESRLPGEVSQDVYVEQEGAANGELVRRDAVIVHSLYARPCVDFPSGAHIEWIDKAPNEPILAEAWPWRLPYFVFVPRPGPGHWIKSKGTVDDLRPLQSYFDRLLSMVRLYMDKLGQPPWAIAKGSMVSDSIYSDRGYFEYHPGMPPPQQAQIPSEPTQVIGQHLAWCMEQMGEIANLPPVARGVAPGGGIDAAVALRALDENKEQQLSGTAAEFVATLERTMGWVLECVGRHFNLPRLVASPGVDDAEELAAFTGDALRGCTRFAVTGSVMPRQRAAQLQTALSLMQVIGPQMGAYVGGFITGDVSEFVEHTEAQAQLQKRETRKLCSLGATQGIDEVYAQFQQDVNLFSQALQQARANPQMEPVPGPPDPLTGQPSLQMAPMDPMKTLAAAGIFPPKLSDRIRDLGVQGLPMPEDFHDHATHLARLDDFRVSDAYDRLHPAVQQLLREHADAHKQALGQQVASMAQQEPRQQGPQGSAPAPKGKPSPPKSPGQPGGSPQPSPLGGSS